MRGYDDAREHVDMRRRYVAIVIIPDRDGTPTSRPLSTGVLLCRHKALQALSGPAYLGAERERALWDANAREA